MVVVVGGGGGGSGNCQLLKHIALGGKNCGKSGGYKSSFFSLFRFFPELLKKRKLRKWGGGGMFIVGKNTPPRHSTGRLEQKCISPFPQPDAQKLYDVNNHISQSSCPRTTRISEEFSWPNCTQTSFLRMAHLLYFSSNRLLTVCTSRKRVVECQ